MAGAEFVEGWLVAQVLGEGAYGEVRLLVHARTGATVALKALGGGQEAAREAALHRALKHQNVLRCLGDRAHVNTHYLFLEYAQGGELFDRIEPDVGMPARLARSWWRQLLLGLGYLHSRGVAHRDIKPENLLLDHKDTLKISDFGMATIFRHGSRERLMSRVCGTLPYAAPEVLTAAERPYRAPPADLWAAALVLLAMLAGELPWERAHNTDHRYMAWRGTKASPAVWRKLRPSALSLLRGALAERATDRPTLQELLNHAWMKDGGDQIDSGSRIWSSQPLPSDDNSRQDLSAADMDELLSYSQPAQPDDLLLSTQNSPQLTQQSVLQRLVRRMTRVWMRVDEVAALKALLDVLGEKRYTWRQPHPRQVLIECGEVKMRAWAVATRAADGCGAGGVVLEFRRSRGCGLEFKRRYLELRDALRPLSAPPPADPRTDLLAEPLAVSSEKHQPMDQT